MAESWSNRYGSERATLTTVTGVRVGKPVTKVTTPTAIRWTSSRTCNNTPNYASILESGRFLPNNGFVYKHTNRSYPSGERQNYVQVFKDGRQQWLLDSYSAGYYSYTTYDPEVPATLATSDVESRLKTLANNKLLSRIKDNRGNMAVAAAEAGKTLNMMSRAVESIAKTVHDLRKGDFAAAGRHLGVTTSPGRLRRLKRTARKDKEKAAASAWLGFQYGWKPLVQTVYDCAQDLASIEYPFYINHARVRCKEEFRVQDVTDYSTSSTTDVTVDTTTGHIEVTKKCTFAMRNSVAKRAALNGLSNPALVAWELVPYSFVIDWIYPLGNFIDLLDATSGLVFYGGYTTIAEVKTTTRDVVVRTNALKMKTTQGIESVSIVRTKLNDFPSPQLPDFKNPLSVSHLASAWALITNLRK